MNYERLLTVIVVSVLLVSGISIVVQPTQGTDKENSEEVKNGFEIKNSIDKYDRDYNNDEDLQVKSRKITQEEQQQSES